MLSFTRLPQITSDGTHTLFIPELAVTYHSRFGAVQESLHVFIREGLQALEREGRIAVFEMGFGTGLNAFLTAREAQHSGRRVHYTAVEAYPLSEEEIKELNYPDLLGQKDVFLQLHAAPWEQDVAVTDTFTLHKVRRRLEEFLPALSFDLVYYDAFAPGVQPELWTEEVFRKLYRMMETNGILVTYCSKGAVRRALAAAGFAVEKVPGPPGKREMLRAVKRSV